MMERKDKLSVGDRFTLRDSYFYFITTPLKQHLMLDKTIPCVVFAMLLSVGCKQIFNRVEEGICKLELVELKVNPDGKHHLNEKVLSSSIMDFKIRHPNNSDIIFEYSEGGQFEYYFCGFSEGVFKMDSVKYGTEKDFSNSLSVTYLGSKFFYVGFDTVEVFKYLLNVEIIDGQSTVFITPSVGVIARFYAYGDLFSIYNPKIHGVDTPPTDITSLVISDKFFLFEFGLPSPPPPPD